jgi:hypothetical protein
MQMQTQEERYRDYVQKILRQLDTIFKTQSTNNGSFISTNGTKLVWSVGGSSLPDQTGNSGKFLTTNGSASSWASVPGSTWGAITGTLSSQTDLQTALNAKESTANKGAVNGYASLDGSGLVPSSQLPSYVDDVVEYANLAALPVTGVTGKIYVTLDTNKTYRWSGSAYVEISSTLPAGSNTQIQYNNSGVLGASASLTWNGTQLKVDNIVILGGSNAITNNEGLSSWSTVLNGGGGLYDIRYNSISKLAVTSTGVVTITPNTLTGSTATSLLAMSQTWNTTGTPTAIKLNVTNAASNAASLLMDLQLGGSSVFKVGRTQSTFGSTGTDGFVNFSRSSDGVANGQITVGGGAFNITSQQNGALNLQVNGTTLQSLASTGSVSFTPGTYSNTSSTVTPISQVSTFAAAAGSANFRPINIAYTLNNSGAQSGTATGIFLNATETALNGMTHRLMELQANGSKAISVHKPDANSSEMRLGSNGGDVVFNVAGNTLSIAVTSGNHDVSLPGALFQRTGVGFGAILSGVATASSPNVLMNGTWYSGGTSTTTKPAFLVQPTGTTSTNWSTSGTGIGVNAASGFAGNLLDLQVAGASVFRVSSGGTLNVSGSIAGSVNIQAGTTGIIYWSSSTLMSAPSDGLVLFRNNAGTDFSRLQFGGTTSSFPSLKRSGALIEVKLADDSAYASITADNVYARGVIRLGGTNDNRISDGGAGIIRLTDAAATSFDRLQLGGSTSSYPALKRNSAAIDVKLADDSGYAALNAGITTATRITVAGQYVSSEFALTDGTTIALNWNNGNVQTVTLGGNRTFTFANPINGGRYMIILTQDATGSRTITWPTVKWRGGVAPTLTTAAGRADIITFVYAGGSYYGDASLTFV